MNEYIFSTNAIVRSPPASGLFILLHMKRDTTPTEKHIDSLMTTRAELQNAILHFSDEQIQVAHIFSITRLKRLYNILRIENNNYEPYHYCSHCGARMKIREVYCEECGAEQSLSN